MLDPGFRNKCIRVQWLHVDACDLRSRCVPVLEPPSPRQFVECVRRGQYEHSPRAQCTNRMLKRFLLLAHMLEHLDHRDGVVVALTDWQAPHVALKEFASFSN